jgi:biotin carboxyl carrier protein
MKMKNILLSNIDGKVKEVKVEPGDMVFKNQVLVEFE